MSQTLALIVLVAMVMVCSEWIADTPLGRRVERWAHLALTFGSASWRGGGR